MYDSTDAVGKLLFNVLAMVAEFDADLIRLHTKEGMPLPPPGDPRLRLPPASRRRHDGQAMKASRLHSNNIGSWRNASFQRTRADGQNSIDCGTSVKWMAQGGGPCSSIRQQERSLLAAMNALGRSDRRRPGGSHHLYRSWLDAAWGGPSMPNALRRRASAVGALLCGLAVCTACSTALPGMPGTNSPGASSASAGAGSWGAANSAAVSSVDSSATASDAESSAVASSDLESADSSSDPSSDSSEESSGDESGAVGAAAGPYQQSAHIDDRFSNVWGDDNLVVTADGDLGIENDIPFATYSPDGEPEARPQPVPDLHAQCGIVVAPSDGTDLIYGVTVHKTEAQGIQPATYTPYLTAYSSQLVQQWEEPLSDPLSDDLDCTDHTFVKATTDGKWVSVAAGDVNSYVSIDTHYVTATMTAYLPVGDLLVDTGQETCGSACGQDQPAAVSALDPTTGKKLSFPITGPSNKLSAGDVIMGILDSGTWAAVDGSTVIGTGTLSGPDGMSEPWGVVDLHARTVHVVPGVPDFSSTSEAVADPDAKVVIAGDQVGISAVTDKVLWDLKAPVNICAAGHGKIVVSANDQLATLDSTTGKQLSFSTVENQCPYWGTFGGYGWFQDANIINLTASGAGG